MLQMANGDVPKSFNNFTTIIVKNRRLSSATVSKRLKELLAVDAIREAITKSKTGRRVITYTTTEKGRKLIKLVKEFNEVITLSKSK